MAKDLDRGEQAFGLEGLDPEGSITTNYFLVVMAELALHHTFDPWCLGALVANKTSLGERLQKFIVLSVTSWLISYTKLIPHSEKPSCLKGRCEL